MAASDVPDPFTRPGATRVVTIEGLERRLLCADADAPAGFVPTAPDVRLYQLTMHGEIAPAGDQDFFALGRLVAGDVVTVGLPAAGSGRGTLSDGLIELYRASANPGNPTRIVGNDDGGSANDALMLRQVIDTDGTYFIKASAAFSEWTGTYALAMQMEARPASPVTSRTGGPWNESEPNGNALTANDASAAWRRVNYVSSQPGSVGANPATRIREHPYSLRAGDLVTFAVDSTSELDATLALVDDSGTEVFALDHGDGVRGAGDERDAAIFAYRAPRSGVYRARVAGNDLTVGAYRTDVFLSRQESAVVGRFVFYNNTVYDGRSPAPGPGDDAAVALDKVALLPNHAATLANVTNFSAGINGVMVDVAGLQAELDPTDFDFAMSTPGGWVAAPAPSSVSRRAGAGINSSDRITLTWADGAIVDRWLRVTVKATDATRLAADDVFLFGNLVGETGDDPAAATVTVADVMRVRAALGASADTTSWLDFNRDGRVNAFDHAAARARVSRGLPFFAATPTVSAPSLDLPVIHARPPVPAPRRSLYDTIVDAIEFPV